MTGHEQRPIPVTTFNLPNGAQDVGYFQRSEEVTEKAFRIIDAGYRFTFERLRTGWVSMCVESADADEDIELVAEHPESVREGFDRLVTRFSAYLPASLSSAGA